MSEADIQFRHIGTRPVRPDGVDKVTGRALYGTDFKAPGMLWGAILRSPHAHARILGIDAGKALALPEVKAVVTGQDFPVLKSVVLESGEGADDVIHLARNCMAFDKALYEGHAVAAVAATTAEAARAALALIEVSYEVLPHVLGIEEALAEDAPLLHQDFPGNVAGNVHREIGDVAAAMARADVIVEARYQTEPVHQGYIEPHACVVSCGADGQAQIWGSSQGHFMVRQLTASILAMREADIRVMPLEIGGGFGGKTTVYLEPVGVLLSRKAGRPVRLAMSRDEVFRASGPAPGAIVDIKLGASAQGTLLALEAVVGYHSGSFPHASCGPGIASACGHYRIADYRLDGLDVLCNRPTTKAYRAPSAPQINFAVESAIDELALKLGMDPLELRLKNAARPGDPMAPGMPWGNIGWFECLEAAKAHPHWSAPLGPNQGRGVAGGYWGNYGGPSTASVSLAEDGTVIVTTGNPDIGGSRAAMAIMAAEVLDVPIEQVRVTVADTGSIGYSMVTAGSRTTFATGRAVTEAAHAVKAQVIELAAQAWQVSCEAVGWREGAALCLSGAKAGARLTMAELVGRSLHSSGPVAALSAINAGGWLPGFGVHICDVEVDRETGNARVVRYTAVQDVGRAIHPAYVEGQMQGGAAQGIGWALNECYIYDEQGHLANPGFLDYRMPVASDLPMIDTVMVEVPNPAHPYGVKGVGEVPIVPPLAAVANAVSRAIDRRMRGLPLAPDKVWAALQR